MILTSRAPVRWPDQAQIDAAWAAELDDPSGGPVIGDDGMLRMGGETSPFRLVGGTHLEPGATYRLEDPRLFATEVTARVEGHPGARTLVAEYRTVTGWRGTTLGGLAPRGAAPARATLEGIDSVRRATTTGDVPYLSWDATFEPSATQPFTAQVRLRWLRVRLVARVSGHSGQAPGGEPGPGELECELEVTGRGRWSPVVGAALSLGGRFLRSGFEESVAQGAQAATAVSEGRRPVRPQARDRAAELQRHEQAVTIVRLRLHGVLDQVEQRPRWRQTRGALLSAYAALPPAGWWPDPVQDVVAWEDYERLVAGGLANDKPAERRVRLQERLDRDLAHQASIARAHGVAVDGSPQDPPLPVRDGQLDLRWLRSPLTLWRFARTAPSPPPEAGPSSGTPGVPAD